MRKRLCLIVGPVAATAALFAVPAVSSAQTCSTDPDYCPANRVDPTGFTATTTPARDRSYPYTFVTKGRLGVPRSIGNLAGCDGRAIVTYKAKKTTISTRVAYLRLVNGRCVYRSKVTFAWVRRLETLGGTPLRFKVIVRFIGNAHLSPVKHDPYFVVAG